jgi:hypothetical protein
MKRFNAKAQRSQRSLGKRFERGSRRIRKDLTQRAQRFLGKRFESEGGGRNGGARIKKKTERKALKDLRIRP